MQRFGNIWSRKAPASWRMGEGTSWPLTVALHVRDAYGLPATRPFFVPPLVPEVPDHIPVTGPAGDVALADEWADWFGQLAWSRAAIHGTDGLLLEDCSPAFRNAVERLLPEAAAAAENFRVADGLDMRRRWEADGPALPRLVRSIEKELGRKAAPFELEIVILPVAGQWLHWLAPQRVLMNRAAQSDPAVLRRLLGPVIRELA